MTYDATPVGFHKSKNGTTFYIASFRKEARPGHRVIGWDARDGGKVFAWSEDGRYPFDRASGFDLVEYLGPELPKPKRKVKMAPFLLKGVDGRPYLSQTFYRDGDDYPGGSDVVIRHLIGTPYEIEVEVEE
jgi:hypothetical protein